MGAARCIARQPATWVGAIDADGAVDAAPAAAADIGLTHRG